MTALLEGAMKRLTRGTDLGARVGALEAACEAARGRLDDSVLDQVGATLDRATARLRLSADHTIVAVAGATGSGKSSTFNALTGLDLAAVGVRRPTTSWATACVWGAQGAEELLDWLGIPPRHQVMRDSMLDTSHHDADLQGAILLDLPDHDSTEVSHHLEVDRLVQLADLMVWVLDPQKYADAAIHDRYLAPMSTHADVMMVVLNHIDVVAPEKRETMLADIRRLLAADGLPSVPVLAISARTGEGVPQLHAEIARRVAAKRATKSRVEADLKAAASGMLAASGDEKPRLLSQERVEALRDALADAAGVPTVVHAVETSTRLRANRATGWPLVSWLSRLRPDPLKRLHLDLGAAGKHLTRSARTSVPQATAIQHARVDTEVRALAEQLSEGLTPAWATAIRKASVSRVDDVADRLDAALGATDLGADRIPVWAGVVRLLQWLLILTALGGALWLGALAGFSYLRLPEPPTYQWRGFPVPTLMLLGGGAAGILLALVCRVLVAGTARRRARVADRRLRAAIDGVTEDLVVAPVRAELAAYDEVRAGLTTALR
ncbi:MAG: GTPase [Nocardioides sp.]